MNINLKLFSQALSFAILIWFTVKFVWPPLLAAIESRQKTIADGLAHAERAKHDLDLAAKRSADILREAKEKAGEIVSYGEKRASEIIEEAKAQAKIEGDRIIAGASKILGREIDAKAHNDLLDKLVAEI